VEGDGEAVLDGPHAERDREVRLADAGRPLDGVPRPAGMPRRKGPGEHPAEEITREFGHAFRDLGRTLQD
jgi:hypothetical protein